MGKNNIFDLFRDNQDRLNEAPSPQTWNRIEKRLEARRAAQTRRRFVYFRQPMGMVAGLALLMGLAVAFMWLANPGPGNEQIAALGQPTNLEDLDLNSSTAVPDWEIAEIAVKTPVQQQKTITEGSRPQQQLVVRNTPRPANTTPSNMQNDSARSQDADMSR